MDTVDTMVSGGAGGTSSALAGVAGRYATALFELAREDKALDEINTAMERLANLLEESPDLRRLVRSPVLTAMEKWQALSALLARANIEGVVVGFAGLLARKRRLSALERIITAWRFLLARHNGEVTAEVTSAKALTQTQLDVLMEVLKETVGAQVRVVLRVDEALLAGLVVRIGSRMVDLSLAMKLDRLKTAMLKTAMKEVG
ncbi:MAG: F0F1 ATP synthase subunit delta [Parvularculales bacterium]